MFTRPIAFAVIALAPLSLVACSKQSPPEQADSSSDGAHEHSDKDDHADTADHADHDATEEPTMSADSQEDHSGHDADEAHDAATPEAFAVLITKALNDGDTETIVSNIKAVNLPEGWQQMILPMFLDLKGRNLEGKIQPRSDFTNEQLSWPEQTPEPYKAVEQILFISYEADSESGSNTFPLILEDGQWKLLLAQ
jgi:hypothetical protein